MHKLCKAADLSSDPTRCRRKEQQKVTKVHRGRAGMAVEELMAPTEPISLADVGAACIAEVPVYKPLLDAGPAHLHAFEGDPRQIAKI
jgi:hypothetical protein